MRVADLVNTLMDYDPDLEVHMTYFLNPFEGPGDWVAPRVNDTKETNIVWSDRFKLPKLADHEDAQKTVVVLIT